MTTNIDLWSSVRTALNPAFKMEYLKKSIPEMAAGGVQLANILAGFDGKDLEVQVRSNTTLSQYTWFMGHTKKHRCRMI
jgi:hypothetical protein